MARARNDRWICEVDWTIHPTKKAAERCEASHFVEKEMKHRGNRSRTQAIAIGLSRARAAGIKVPKKH